MGLWGCSFVWLSIQQWQTLRSRPCETFTGLICGCQSSSDRLWDRDPMDTHRTDMWLSTQQWQTLRWIPFETLTGLTCSQNQNCSQQPQPQPLPHFWYDPLDLTPSSPDFCNPSHIWRHSQESCYVCLYPDFCRQCYFCKYQRDEGHYGSGGGWGAAAKNVAFFLYYGPLLQDISPLRPSPLPVPLLSSPVLLNGKSFYCPHKL